MNQASHKYFDKEKHNTEYLLLYLFKIKISIYWKKYFQEKCNQCLYFCLWNYLYFITTFNSYCKTENLNYSRFLFIILVRHLDTSGREPSTSNDCIRKLFRSGHWLVLQNCDTRFIHIFCFSRVHKIYYYLKARHFAYYPLKSFFA